MKASAGNRVLMLLENNPFPQDSRVRCEATTLTTAGYHITVICPAMQGQPWRETLEGIRVYRFPSPPDANGLLGYAWEYLYSFVAILILSIVVRWREGFDVIHAHNPPDFFVLVAAIYRLLGTKFIFDQHDLSPEMYEARFGKKGNWFIYSILTGFEKLSCKFADHVIATNQSYKQLQMRRSRISEERITIVRNGPELDRLKVTDCVLPGLKKSGKTILCYVGVMGVQDGVDYLLRALNHLRFHFNRADFFCILVGDGDAWIDLKALAERLELVDCVQFIGRVEHTQVVDYLNVADICVAPEPSNAYNEQSTMIKVMEYMAMGKPVVAFDLFEHRVTAQESALYAKPNDEIDFARQIVSLMENPRLRKDMGRFGRKRVETALAWQCQAKYLIKSYEMLNLQGRKNGGVNSKLKVG